MVRAFRLVMPVAAILLTFQPSAHAYLDPGSGSMMLQVLLGGFAAVGVAARLYWHRVTAIFRRKDVEPDRR